MTDTTSFNRLRMLLTELLKENQSRTFDSPLCLPFRDGRAVDAAIVRKLLLRPTEAFP